MLLQSLKPDSQTWDKLSSNNGSKWRLCINSWQCGPESDQKGPTVSNFESKPGYFCLFLRGKEDAFGTNWSRVGKGKRLMGRRVLHRCFHLPPYLDYSDKSCQRIAIFATKLKGWWEKGNVWKCRNAGSLLTASSQLLMEPHGDLRKSENKRRL